MSATKIHFELGLYGKDWGGESACFNTSSQCCRKVRQEKQGAGAREPAVPDPAELDCELNVPAGHLKPDIGLYEPCDHRLRMTRLHSALPQPAKMASP